MIETDECIIIDTKQYCMNHKEEDLFDVLLFLVLGALVVAIIYDKL